VDWTDKFAAHPVAAAALHLVRAESISNTAGEAAFAGMLQAFLVQRLKKTRTPCEVRLIPSHGSPLASTVAALVRGRGKRSVVLAGHYDVVATGVFGSLRHIAFEPSVLMQALLDELETARQGTNEASALADLRSGQFLPGRGMLDMKSGLAAGIAVLERFSTMPEAVGNVLFVATPDEENRSRGMRSLRDALSSLAQEWEVEFVGGINLDATDDYGDGSLGRSIYFGSVGKFSPFAYVVGSATHASYPFEGCSAHLIGAEIIRALEYNAALVDGAYGETVPPPVCLEARDFRASYDVTTPDRSWLSFNWLSHRRTPEELLNAFRGLVDASLEKALSYRESQAAMLLCQGAALKGRVFTVAELKADVFRRNPDASSGFDRLMASLAGEMSPLVISQRLVGHLVDEARLDAPAVIIGFASLFYPPVHTDNGPFRSTVLEAAARAVSRHGTTITAREFFPGISDMSFFGQRPDPAQFRIINDNTLSADVRDVTGGDAPVFPIVNIGPWGPDCHKKLERVHAPYAFDVLPDVVAEVAEALLRA